MSNMKYLEYLSKDITGETNILVAEDAMSILYCRYDDEVNTVYLSCLQVREQVRHRGRAKEVLYKAEKWANKMGAENISLECNKDIVQFFQKMGYEVTYQDHISVFMTKKPLQ